MKKLDYIQFIVIDLFCGAGGTTLGFEQAESDYDDMYRFLKSYGITPPTDRETFFRISKVIACVNHDHLAITSHWKNHPDVKHFEEDIRLLNPYGDLKLHVDHYRKLYPHAKVILWASLECTNFSKAKGGQPRDADSRTLAEHLYKYIDALNPDYIKIENVVEFMAWGPLDENGKPVSKKAGTDWLKWRAEICKRGYYDDWKQLNSADFGAYTSRNRLFGVFAKNGLPIAWPTPTHHKKPETVTVPVKRWEPVKKVLDFDDEGLSIFNRKKPLSTKTMQRLFMGCVKHIAGGKEVFLSKYYSGNPQHKNITVDQPAGAITCPVIATQNRLGKVKAEFIDLQFSSGKRNQSIEEPLGAITTVPKSKLVQADFFIDKQFSGDDNHYIVNPSWGGNSGSVEEPCHVVIARQDKAPLYVITCSEGPVAVPVYEDDCEWTIKLKEFMALYNICDIKMRMLKVLELKKIQGFPADYILLGNQTDQKKFIGNAVHPLVPKFWIEAFNKRLAV